MLLILGTIRIAPERLDDARPVMRRMAEATRAEPGCLAYHYAEDVLEPGLIHVVEHWTDGAAIEAHFGMPHIQEWRAAWPELGIHDRRLQLFEAGEPSPI
jgi:quinol monooxygenase YgiN